MHLQIGFYWIKNIINLSSIELVRISKNGGQILKKLLNIDKFLMFWEEVISFHVDFSFKILLTREVKV